MIQDRPKNRLRTVIMVHEAPITRTATAATIIGTVAQGSVISTTNMINMISTKSIMIDTGTGTQRMVVVEPVLKVTDTDTRSRFEVSSNKHHSFVSSVNTLE